MKLFNLLITYLLLCHQSLAIDNPDSPFQDNSFETSFQDKWKKFEKASNTRAGEEALEEVIKFNDKTLTELLSKAKKHLDKDLYEKLITAQKSWEVYKDHEIELLILQRTKNPASSQNTNILTHKVTLSKQRIEELTQFLRTL